MEDLNLIKDLSLITTIPESALNKLVDKAVWCICDSLQDTKLEEKNLTTIDIGIGKLLILDGEEDISYKFIPSQILEESIKSTLIDNKNPLKLTLEKTLIDKIMKTYKDII